MRVDELMTHPVVTCSVEASLNTAAQLMWEHDCGAIPVVDEEGRLASAVTDRDICMASYTQGRRLEDIPVTTVMASQVLACHIDDSVETAEQLMREGQVRRIPIIDNDGRPVGIISMNDLARVAAHAKKPGIDREIVETLAAICEPRRPVQQVVVPQALSPTSQT